VNIAGGRSGLSNNDFFLRTNGWYWTMSPMIFSGNDARVGSIGAYGNFGSGLTSNSGVRPVISLNYDVEVLRGNGSATTPFIINIETSSATQMLRAEVATPSSFLNTGLGRHLIETITFVNTNIVPNGVIGSWDVSAAGDGGVMAWTTPGGTISVFDEECYWEFWDYDYCHKDIQIYNLFIGAQGGVLANPNSSNLFAHTVNLSSLSLNSLDVSTATNMQGMFSNAGAHSPGLNTDLSNWDVSNVTNMQAMFSQAGNGAFNVGNLSNWNVSNVTNMNNMFNMAGRGTTFNIGNINSWDVSNVINMVSMFNGAGNNSFNIGDLSTWDVSSVTNMMAMFNSAGQSAPTFNLNLSSWNVSNVTNMSSMFNSAGGYSNTWSIGDLSNWNVSNVTNMSSMFALSGQRSPTFNLNLSNWNVSNVTNMSNMFAQAALGSTSVNINLSNWNIPSTTTVTGMFSLFNNHILNARVYVSSAAMETRLRNQTSMPTNITIIVNP